MNDLWGERRLVEARRADDWAIVASSKRDHIKRIDEQIDRLRTEIRRLQSTRAFVLVEMEDAERKAKEAKARG